MTFTLLAADPGHGLLAAATASRSLAVGNAVIAVDPAVGAVASQAWTNRALRARMLDALAAGRVPAEVMAEVPRWDEGAALRQVAALLPDGRGEARTGEGTTPWAGAIVRPGVVAVGNLLTGPEVLDAVVARFGALSSAAGEDAEGGWEATTAADDVLAAFARRVVAAMQAGEDAGGDRRGRQSAAVVVSRRRPERAHPPELEIDLRVDDAAEPLHELARLLETQLAG